MTAIAPELISEGLLDFEFTPPCDHSEHQTDKTDHQGAAYVMVRAICDVCPLDSYMYLCERYWTNVVLSDLPWMVECDCGTLMKAKDSYIFVSYVNGRKS